MQFRTLHNLKTVIKSSNLICGFCNKESGSMQHMILNCEVSKHLRSEVNDWIVELGMLDYDLSHMKFIVGDVENALVIRNVILITKKVIYTGHLYIECQKCH